jgi:hypothetical protein
VTVCVALLATHTSPSDATATPKLPPPKVGTGKPAATLPCGSTRAIVLRVHIEFHTLPLRSGASPLESRIGMNWAVPVAGS